MTKPDDTMNDTSSASTTESLPSPDDFQIIHKEPKEKKGIVQRTGAVRRMDLLAFDPETLYIENDDKESPYYDGRAVTIDRSMVESIKMLGITNPIRVVEEDADENGVSRMIVLDGRNRVRHARIANQEFKAEGSETRVLVSAQVARSTAVTLNAMMIASNHFRRESTVMEKVGQLARHLEMGGTPTSASLSFGVSLNCIYQWQRLLSCSPATQKAVNNGLIPIEAAKLLCKLDRAKQAEAVAEMTKDGTVATKGKKAQAAASKAAGKRPRPQDQEAAKKRLSKLEIEQFLAQTTEHLDVLNAYGLGLRDAMCLVLGMITAEDLDWPRADITREQSLLDAGEADAGDAGDAEAETGE